MNGSSIKAVLRSSSFLAVDAFLFIFSVCSVRFFLRRFYRYSLFFVPAFLGSLGAILVEKKGRRGLLAGYTSVVALEFLNTLLKSRGVLPPFPQGDVLLFSAASSYLFYYFKTHKGSQDIISSILRVLMSPKLPRPLVRLLKSSVVDNRVTRIAVVGAWCFLLGYGLQAVLTLLGQFSKRFKLRDVITRMRQILFSKRNLQFGAFLGSYSAGFLAINSILWYLPLPRSLRLLLAGFLAGLAAVFYRSNSLSLYMASKSLELLFFEGVRLGYYRPWYYGDAVLYALGTATIFHAAFFHGHLIRPAYWNFLVSATKQRVMQVNFDEVDKFGTSASRKPREEHMNRYKRAVAAGNDMASPSTYWEPAEVKEMRAEHKRLKESESDVQGDKLS